MTNSRACTRPTGLTVHFSIRRIAALLLFTDVIIDYENEESEHLIFREFHAR